MWFKVRGHPTSRYDDTTSTFLTYLLRFCELKMLIKAIFSSIFIKKNDLQMIIFNFQEYLEQGDNYHQLKLQHMDKLNSTTGSTKLPTPGPDKALTVRLTKALTPGQTKISTLGPIKVLISLPCWIY